MIDRETDLKAMTSSSLLDILKIMLQAQPQSVSVMDARDLAVKRLKAELVQRPLALYEFVENRLMWEK